MLTLNHNVCGSAAVAPSRHRAPFRPAAETQPLRRRSTAAHAQPGGSRRELLSGAGTATLAALMAQLAGAVQHVAPAAAEEALSNLEPMEALKGKGYGKPRMSYGDYVKTPSGLQYVDLREGAGGSPAPGDTCVVDWDGYTIGYYGRPFEARNKPKGSSFVGDNKDYLRFVLGQGSVIPAFEEAVAGMKVGGIRRVIVPVELGYPDNNFRKQGPRPSTFAGERALDFVLSNQGMIDKTLLFDLELVRIDAAGAR